MAHLGDQLLLDLAGVEASRLDDVEGLRRLLVSAARRAGATVVEARFHHFSPHGVSGVVILAESHLAVHTWPEHGTAAIDIFTCGDPALTTRIGEAVEAALEPRSAHRQAIERGAPRLPGSEALHVEAGPEEGAIAHLHHAGEPS